MGRSGILQSVLGEGASSTQRRVGRVLLVVLAGAALQILTQTLLARTLPKPEVGLISLVLGALPILSTLSLVGQDASIVRFLTRSPVGAFDTRAHIRRVLGLVLPLGVIAGLAATWFYGLEWGLSAVLVVLVVSQNSVTVVTSVERAAHRYELAMTGARLPVMSAAVVLLILRAAGALTYGTAVLGLGLAFGLSALFVALRGRSAVPSGAERVPRSVMTEGLLFLGLGISFAVMIAVDKLIIGKMMTYADLAVYASVFAIMRGFDFLFYSLNYVLMPRVNVVESLSLRRLNLPIAGLAAIVAALYLLIGDDVLSRLYVGLYDEGAHLILPFALSGVAKLFYSVPSSVIGGRLPRSALRQFMWFNLAGMGLNVVLDIVLIGAMGLRGAAVATIIAWVLRLAGGYVIIALNRSHLGPGRAGAVEV